MSTYLELHLLLEFRYIYRAESNKMEAAIIIDHIDILKKLNASKLLIKEKILFALNRYACAAAHAINGAKMSGEINDAQGNEAIKHTMTLSKSKDIDPIYESYMKKVTAGTKNLAESIDRNKDEINNLRKNKTWFWLIAIGLNSIGGIIAVISSLKENKNNTALSSVTTPVKKENQDGEGRDCRGLIR